MEPYDIYNGTWPFHDCDDTRPWLIIELRGSELVACLPISGECYSGIGFELNREHPDFPLTGLSKTCYILDEQIFDLPVGVFGKRRGCLAKELLVSFRDYAGL